jgi:hypothetical protein
LTSFLVFHSVGNQCLAFSRICLHFLLLFLGCLDKNIFHQIFCMKFSKCYRLITLSVIRNLKLG